MKRNKLTTMVILMLVLSLMLSACGKSKEVSDKGEDSTASETSSATTEATVAVEEPVLEEVNLIWYVAGATPKDAELVQDAMSVITKEKINATVELRWIDYGNYPEKLNLMLSSGEDFDLCLAASWLGFGVNASKDAYYDISEILPTVAPTLESVIPQAFWDSAKVKGKIVAIPNIQPTAQQKKLTIITDDALTAAFHPENIKSMADWEDYIGRVFASDYKDNPKFAPLSVFVQPILDELLIHDFINFTNEAPAAVDISGDATKVINYMETDKYKEFIAKRGEWYKKGWIRQDILTYYNNPDARAEDYKAGKYILGEIGGYTPMTPGSKKADEAILGMKNIFIDLGSKKVVSTNSIQATMTAINSNSKNPERALMFMELMNTNAELYNLMCYGIEGTHYELKDGGVFYPEEIAGDKSSYNPNSAWQFGMTINALPLTGAPVPEGLDTWDTEGIYDNPLMGFSPNFDNIKTELAQCQAINDSLAAAIELGAVDWEEFYPQMMEQFKTAGIDKVIAELQTQVDAFLATK